MSIAENKESMCIEIWLSHRRAKAKLDPLTRRTSESQCIGCGAFKVKASYISVGNIVYELERVKPDIDCNLDLRIDLPV